MKSARSRWCLPLLLGFTLAGAAGLADADQIFRDDFTRYDLDVGNGWAQLERDYDDVYCHGIDAANAVLQLRDRRDAVEPDAAVSRLISTVGYTDLKVHVSYSAFSWSTQFWSDPENPYPDLLKVEYTVDGGSTWSTAGTEHLMTTSWKVYTVSLPTAANGQANFGLRLASDLDESKPNDLSDRGMRIDYVLVEGTPAADTTAPAVSINKPTNVIFSEDAVVTATATDSESNIRSAEYSRDGTPWVAMSATDGAFDEKSEDLRATLDGLLVQTYEVCVKATDINDNTSDGTACDTFDVTAATLEVAFAGQLLDVDGPQTELKVEVTGPCASGAEVEFLVDSGAGYVSHGTKDTDASGVAILNANLAAGVYDMKVVVAGQDMGGDSEPECLGDWDTGITVVADTRASSTGGGWYKIEGLTPPRVNFGYTAQTKYDKKLGQEITKGNLVWIHQDSYRLKGVIDSGGKLSGEMCDSAFAACAVFSGKGTVYEHNPEYDPDCSSTDSCGIEWINASPNTPFVFFVNDGGTERQCVGKKNCKEVEKPDQFGIEILLESIPAESGPVYLNGGNLVVK